MFDLGDVEGLKLLSKLLFENPEEPTSRRGEEVVENIMGEAKRVLESQNILQGAMSFLNKSDIVLVNNALQNHHFFIKNLR